MTCGYRWITFRFGIVPQEHVCGLAWDHVPPHVCRRTGERYPPGPGDHGYEEGGGGDE